MAQQFIIIRHANGREYAVTPSVFHDLYEKWGFVVVAYEDGGEYAYPVKDEPATAETKKAAK